MNAPSAKADGFSGKLRGIPHALRLKAGSSPEFGPMQHDTSRGDISIENASAVAAVLPLSERLGFDRAAFWAGLGRPSWIDQPDVDTGAFSLVSDMLEELGPRGVVDGLGEHPAGQADDIEVLHRDVREAIDEPPGQPVRKVPALSIPQSEAYMSGAIYFNCRVSRRRAIRLSAVARRRQSPAGGHDGLALGRETLG